MTIKREVSQCLLKQRMMEVVVTSRVVFVGGGKPGNSPSLDLAFPLTELSENFPARERVIPCHC